MKENNIYLFKISYYCDDSNNIEHDSGFVFGSKMSEALDKIITYYCLTEDKCEDITLSCWEDSGLIDKTQFEDLMEGLKEL